MTYTPQPGDIGLVPISGTVGKAIRVGQYILAKLDDFKVSRLQDDADWADYQHAFVYLGDGQLIEAEPGGARIRDLTEYADGEIYWCQNISAGLTDKQRSAIALIARNFEGTPYSFLDYFVLTAHKLHIWLPGMRNFVNSLHHMICSQLAADSYDLGGVPLFNGEWPGDVDPLDLFLLDKHLGRAK